MFLKCWGHVKDARSPEKDSSAVENVYCVVCESPCSFQIFRKFIQWHARILRGDFGFWIDNLKTQYNLYKSGLFTLFKESWLMFDTKLDNISLKSILGEDVRYL